MDEPGEPRLLDRVHDTIRRKHYSIRTEQAYVDWIKRFILFHDKRLPAKLGATEVEEFHTHLAVDREVAASTQNQAQSALLFLYGEILGFDLPWLDDVERAKRPIKLPVVLTVEEVVRVLNHLKGTHRLIGRLMYGSGLRILEALRLRVKDVDFQRHEILVRDGKGAKDRLTLLPRETVRPLCEHLQGVREMHRQDIDAGFGAVWMPFALARKYPAAPREWAWQYVFPADRRSKDPRGGSVRRHHLGDQSFQRAMRQAVRDAGIHKLATPHTLPHSFCDAPA